MRSTTDAEYSRAGEAGQVRADEMRIADCGNFIASNPNSAFRIRFVVTPRRGVGSLRRDTTAEAFILSRSSLAITLLVLAACGEGSPLGTQFPATLEWARTRWESSAIDSYEITVRPVCFCYFVEPVRLTVENGEIVSRVIVATGDPLPAQYASFYPDVPGLFAIIEHAQANGADAVNTSFDETYGFPTAIWIDWKADWADEEIGYRTEGFAVRQ